MKEVGNIHIDKQTKCPKCKHINAIYDTLPFINALIKRYIEQSKLLQKQQNRTSESGSLETSIDDFTDNISLADIDIHDSDILTQPNNLQPIKQWFKKHNVEIIIDPDAADTTGFFDEVALLIGNNFNLFSGVIKQIVYVQNKDKDYKTVKIALKNYSAKDAKQIVSFCKTLHEYSFVARYNHIKKDQIIYLTLQKANKIKQFFNGFWMEWFILMRLLNFFKEQKTVFSVTRGLEVFSTKDSFNEIDLFCLTKQKYPIFIECKSGEYRQDIEKYLSFQKTFQKRLKLNRDQLIVCVFGLDQKQAQGLTQTYDHLTFVNETSLLDHLQDII